MAVPAASAHLKISTTGRPENRAPLALDAMRGGMRVLSRLSPSGAAAVAERFFLTPRRRPRPAVERDALSSATPLVLPSEHGDLAAWQWDAALLPRDLVEPWRSPSSGRPRVLLVHGWEGRGSQLAAFVEPLTMAGFCVVTFDAPAHGNSPGTRSSFFHFAHAIACAAERFGPFEAIVAHSMGAASTLWASRQAILAERVVMMAPPNDLRDFARSVSRTLGLPDDVEYRLTRRLGERFGVPIEEARGVPMASKMRGALLVVHDEDDRMVPVACGEALARAWPDGKLVKTKGLGHQRILRDPTTVQTVVRFVSEGLALSENESA